MRELEGLAGQHLATPADLLKLGGVTLADLLDDQGEVDPELVESVAKDVLATRPGLRPNQPAIDRTQGLGWTPGKATPTWDALLK